MFFQNLIVTVKAILYYLGLIKLQLEHKALYHFSLCISFLSNFPTPVELAITQLDEHVKVRLTSQLNNGISRVLQNLLKYFNGYIISTSFVLPAAGVFRGIFILDLNDSEFAKVPFGSSL